jgi:hypothetical protein
MKSLMQVYGQTNHHLQELGGELMTGLAVALMVAHAAIGLMMAWIGLTDRRANLPIVTVWFAISMLTAVTLGVLAR